MVSDAGLQPWERRAGETARAHAALMDYCRLGPSRSLAKLLNRPQTAHKPPTTQRYKTLAGWSVKYDWQVRVAAWDMAEEEKRQALWEERRRQLLEADWSQGAKLRDLGARILDEAPRFVSRTETRRDDGSLVITLEIDAALAVKAIQAGSQLQRLATDEPTEHVLLSGAALDAVITAELARLADSSKA